jgi:hypothetical protein
MEVVVNGGNGNGLFATAINANDGIVAAASTAAAQLTTITAIAAATIGQRHHHRECNCFILPSSHHCLVIFQKDLVTSIVGLGCPLIP